jgi:hypothetical protein
MGRNRHDAIALRDSTGRLHQLDFSKANPKKEYNGVFGWGCAPSKHLKKNFGVGENRDDAIALRDSTKKTGRLPDI